MTRVSAPGENIGCVDMGSRGLNRFTITIVVGPIRNSHCPLMIGTFIKDRMASYFQGYMDNVSETRGSLKHENE